MLFCSEQFLVFFSLVFLGYWALPWHRARVWLLVGASFYFYASWNQWLAAIICVSTAMDYFIARGMETIASARWRRLLLLISLVANLSLLVYFKYANFFLHSLEETLHAVGETASLPVLRVILPIGISFYTFEAINYTVDVYRRRIPAERNLGHFMLFITFFPHLVAGPIVRAADFLPQVRRPKHWDWARLQLGVQFFLMGLLKKVAIADRMALYADPVFQDPGSFSSGATWLALLAYALQIYCDFSGYTDMALGTAHMLGYKLARNFNLPYLAVNIAEFWHRWHISLSTWLRDYLFIPLGGSRGSDCPRCRRRLTARNLLITMTLGGLWHGAAWTFVVWGIFHGLLLVAHRAFRDYCQRRPFWSTLLRTYPGTALRMGMTFFAVCLGWVFFRAQTFADVRTIFWHLLVRHSGQHTAMATLHFYCLAGLVVACHALAHFGLWQRWAVRLPAPALGFGYAAIVTVVSLLALTGNRPFIYFQF